MISNTYTYLKYSWWAKAKLLQYVDSQEEFDKYQTYLAKEGRSNWIEYYWSARKFLFLARYTLYYMAW